MEIIPESQHQKPRAADVSWIFEHQQASRNRQEAEANHLRSQPASDDIRVLYFERQVKEITAAQRRATEAPALVLEIIEQFPDCGGQASVWIDALERVESALHAFFRGEVEE